MFEIVTAIKTKYSATPALTGALTGGMYFRKLPRIAGQTAPAMPYAVYSVDADAAEENTGTGYVQTVRVTFEVYGKTAAQIAPGAEAIRDQFFRKPLTLIVGRIISADLSDEGLEDLETDDANQPQVYYTITIEFKQTQTRA